MTYREKTKAICASILLIIKNATVVIPILEGIIYSILDAVSALRKVKSDNKKIIRDAEVYIQDFKGHDGSDVPDSIKKD